MGRASNWAKFTATASIGVVHRGHMKESMNLLPPYLPQGGVSALPYSEGGALYALGLIHSNKGSDGNAEVCLEYFLIDILRDHRPSGAQVQTSRPVASLGTRGNALHGQRIVVFMNLVVSVLLLGLQ